MRKNLLSFILFLFVGILVFGQDQKKVLFLGNSYTAANNLPEMVSQMAASTNNTLEYDSNTPGGFRFLNHANDGVSLGKIQSEAWNFVVLQGQSQETAFPENQLQSEIYPYVESLVQAIRENDECSVPLFYMTWGRKNGDPINCQYVPWFCTYEEMDDVIQETYLFMAQENQAKVSPVAKVWRFLRENNSEIELYTSDESHPSLEGSYAAAAAFYSMIFKKDPTEIEWNSSLSEGVAQNILSATKTVVYDSLEEWDFTLKPKADFSEEIEDFQVNFTEQVENYDFLEWNFGDGNTSTENNPTHIYEEEGDYEVVLTAFLCDKIDEVSKTISIIDMGIEGFSKPNIQFHPNPVADHLFIELSDYSNINQLRIIDLNGRVLKEISVEEPKIKLDLSHLSQGIYFFEIHSNGKTFRKKLIKK